MNNKAQLSVKGVCVIVFLVSLFVFARNWKEYKIATGEKRDIIQENCKKYSAGMAIDTDFPYIAGYVGQKTEYKTQYTGRRTRRRIKKTTAVVVEYYAVPVYKDESGAYHFAAIKCETEQQKSDALKALTAYLLYSSEYSPGVYAYPFTGGTYKMDSDVKSDMAKWLNKINYTSEHGGSVDDYIIPIVFKYTDEDAATLMGTLCILGMSISAVVFAGATIYSAKKAKEEELFGRKVQQSVYSDADDFFEGTNISAVGDLSTDDSQLDSDLNLENKEDSEADSESDIVEGSDGSGVWGDSQSSTDVENLGKDYDNFYSDEDNPFKDFGSKSDICLDAPENHEPSGEESPYNTENAYSAFDFSSSNNTPSDSLNGSEETENFYDQTLEEFEDMYLGEMNMDIAGAFGSMEDNSTDELK